MKLKLALSIAVLALPLAAQPPQGPHGGGPPFLNPEAQRAAGISDAQAKQIGDIFEANRHALIDQRAEVEKKEGDLQVLLHGATVDTAQADKAVDALLDARNKLAKTETLMMVRVRQVVTLEQWNKMHRPGGPGGPGGQQRPPRPPQDEEEGSRP